MPHFKRHAAQRFDGVGAALAAADEPALRELTTPSCFAAMMPTIRNRPAGQRQLWHSQNVDAKIKQVRIGHNASAPNMQYAQVTCEIDAEVVWEILSPRGEVIGGTGKKGEPFRAQSNWVFEGCISIKADPAAPLHAWRLKERL